MSDFSDTVPLWPFMVMGVLGGVALLVWVSIPAVRTRYTRRMAQEQGLELDERGLSVMAPYFARRMRLTSLGLITVCGAVLVGAALDIPLPFEGTEFWVAGMWAFIPLITVGGGIGTVVSALRWPRTSSGTTTLGRLVPPTRADVVSPAEERVLHIVVALGVVLPALVLATGLGDGRPEAIAALVSGVLAALSLLAWRTAADRVLRRRPISGDERSLVWSDALRSDAVRFGMPVPAAFAASAYALVLGTVAAALESSGSRFGGVLLTFGVLVIILGFLGVTINQLVHHPSRRWQQRLHPALSEGGPA